MWRAEQCVCCRRGRGDDVRDLQGKSSGARGFRRAHTGSPSVQQRTLARRLHPRASDDAAVFMEPAACVLRGVDRSGLTAEGVAVVLGAGSMGLLHLLVLRAALPGVCVVCVDPLEQRAPSGRAPGCGAWIAPVKEWRTRCVAWVNLKALTPCSIPSGGSHASRWSSLTRQGGTVSCCLLMHRNTSRPISTSTRCSNTSAGLWAPIRAAWMSKRGCSSCSAAVSSTQHRLLPTVCPLERFEEGVCLARERKGAKGAVYPGSGVGLVSSRPHACAGRCCSVRSK